MAKLRRFLVFLALAFSFGGFTFYAGVVVPIGSDVLGVTTQGFVTRRVTHVINAATAVTVALVFWEAISGRANRNRAANTTLWASIAVVAVTGVALVVWHARLESYLDVESMLVNDSDNFYGVHRIYLWISAVQWLATWPIVWILVDERRRNVESATSLK